MFMFLKGGNKIIILTSWYIVWYYVQFINLTDTDQKEKQNCSQNVSTFCKVRNSPLLIIPKWSSSLPTFHIGKLKICVN